MAAPRQSSGFTLIELLVVITIMMTVLGLVGGSVVSGVAKAEAQTEVISVYNLVKKTGVRSFTSGQGLALSFGGNGVTLTSAKDKVLISKINFEHLVFESQQIVFNRNGMPNIFFIEAQVRGKSRTLDFSMLFQRVAMKHYELQPNVG